ncbi:ATP-grasp domain-containing protein (plasmid) [Klebsiella sp. B345]|uniref:ATP-grasp domain-containing protein n=1 Tax=Klebsiella sp. B345 TaxID=2755398 RepID=UPI003DA99A19
MQIIYPDNYLNQNSPDEAFEQEYFRARERGIHCVLLASEKVDAGKYIFSDTFESHVPVIWRGWMLSKEEYCCLHNAVTENGGKMLESTDEYIRNHHITGWYEHCKTYTPETIFTTPDADFESVVNQLNWGSFFVKDYVKSLTTSRGSVAKDAGEIREILKMLAHFRGCIEGGVSLRRVEKLASNSERRYFVLNNHVFSADDQVPGIVREISTCIDTPFYSIDMAEDIDGQLRLIEIGDGQVSDTKEWNVERLVAAFQKSGI